MTNEDLFDVLAGIIAPVVYQTNERRRIVKRETTIEKLARHNRKIDACDGWRTSDCCGAAVDPDILICGDCRDHCGTQCDDCPEEDCEIKQNRR